MYIDSILSLYIHIRHPEKEEEAEIKIAHRKVESHKLFVINATVN